MLLQKPKSLLSERFDNLLNTNTGLNRLEFLMGRDPNYSPFGNDRDACFVTHLRYFNHYVHEFLHLPLRLHLRCRHKKWSTE